MIHRGLIVTGVQTGVPDSKPVPALKLQGIWLKAMGFPAGSKVSVSGMNGIIVISLLDK